MCVCVCVCVCEKFDMEWSLYIKGWPNTVGQYHLYSDSSKKILFMYGIIREYIHIWPNPTKYKNEVS